MTGRFESLHSCNSPAAAPAPASGQRSCSSWPHHRRRLQPGYLDAGCLLAPQTAVWRGCGWGEGADASHCSSGTRRKKNSVRRRIVKIIKQKRSEARVRKIYQTERIKSKNIVKLIVNAITLLVNSHLADLIKKAFMQRACWKVLLGSSNRCWQWFDLGPRSGKLIVEFVSI